MVCIRFSYSRMKFCETEASKTYLHSTVRYLIAFLFIIIIFYFLGLCMANVMCSYNIAIYVLNIDDKSTPI